MNINYKNNDFQFNLRSSALIFSEDKTKILLFNVEGRDLYLLPGGRVEELEESSIAIKREIEEELGWNNLDYSLLAISEEFVNAKGFNNHQVTFIYKTIYKNEIKENSFKGLEGEWINFEWVDVDKIDQYNVYPSSIKTMINNLNTIYHVVDNCIK